MLRLTCTWYYLVLGTCKCFPVWYSSITKDIHYGSPSQGRGVLRLIEQYDRLVWESPLSSPGCEFDSPVAPSDFDRIILGYRLI